MCMPNPIPEGRHLRAYQIESPCMDSFCIIPLVAAAFSFFFFLILNAGPIFRISKHFVPAKQSSCHPMDAASTYVRQENQNFGSSHWNTSAVGVCICNLDVISLGDRKYR